MSDYTLNVKGSFDDNISGNLNKVKSSLSGITSETCNAGKGVSAFGDILKANLLGSAITTGLSAIADGMREVASAAVEMGKAAYEEGAKLEQSLGGVETLFKDSADIVKKYAATAYETAGISENEYLEQATSFSAALISSLEGDTAKAAEITDTAITDMADNSNKMGTELANIQNAYQGFAKQNYTMLDNLKLGYGGTKTEMQRLLADAQELSGVEYNIDNLSDVYEAIHVIQTELGITGTTAKEAASTMSGSFGQMKSAWKSLLGNITLGNDISDELEAVKNSVSTFADNLLPAVGNILDSLPDVIDGIVDTADELVEKFGSEISSRAGPLLEAGRKMITSIGKGLINAAPKLLSFGSDIVGNVVKGITKNIGSLDSAISNVKSGISDFISGIGSDTNGSVFDGVLNFDTSKLQSDDIFVQLAGLSGGIIDAVLNGWNVAMDLINDINFTEILAGAGEGIITFFKSLFTPERLSDIGSTLVNTLKTLFSTGSEIVAGLAIVGEQIIDALFSSITGATEEETGAATIPEKIFGIVGTLIGNLGDAIIEYTPDTILAGKSLLNNLLSAFEDASDQIEEAIPKFIEDVANWCADENNLSKLVESGVHLVGSIIAGILECDLTMFKSGADIGQSIADGILSIDWGNILDQILTGLARGIYSGFLEIYDSIRKTMTNWGLGFLFNENYTDDTRQTYSPGAGYSDYQKEILGYSTPSSKGSTSSSGFVAGATNNNTNNNNINIYQVPGMSSVDVADEVMLRLNQEGSVY